MTTETLIFKIIGIIYFICTLYSIYFINSKDYKDSLKNNNLDYYNYSIIYVLLSPFFLIIFLLSIIKDVIKKKS